MALFDTRLVVPGPYGQIITEPANTGSGVPTALGVVGSANNGPMETPIRFTSGSALSTTLGNCEAVDLVRAAWGNGAGDVYFVRVGNTHIFDEVWMDNQAGSATDITDEVSRQSNTASVFNTGSVDWLYVGSSTTFNTVYLEFFSDLDWGTSDDRTIEIEYYSPSGWAASGLVSDGTSISSQTLSQSGTIEFDGVEDWVETAAPVAGGGAGTMYWVRLRALEGAPASGALATLIVEVKNALPAYGYLQSDTSFTGAVNTGGSTTFVHAGGQETSWDTLVQSGDVIENVSDGSSATVVSINDGTNTVTTTALAGGYNNLWKAAASVVGGSMIDLVTGSTITAISTDTVTSTITDSTATFITDRVAPGDLFNDTETYNIVSKDDSDNSVTIAGDHTDRFTVGVVLTIAGAAADNGAHTVVSSTFDTTNTIIEVDEITADAGAVGTVTITNTAVIVSVLSETQLLVTADATTWDVGDDYYIHSARVLKVSAGGNFSTNGLRPGDVVSLSSGGTANVVSVISDTVLITDGILGGSATRFSSTLTYSYSKAADTYKVYSFAEKAYLEALEPGTDGRNITVKITTSGQNYVVTLEKNGYIEEYKVAATADDRLLRIVDAINTGSQLVVAEIVDGVGDDDIPTTMAETAFTGGNNGTATDADYVLGLEQLLSVPSVGVVFVAADASDAINAALKSHVAAAAGLDFQILRQAVCMKPEDESILRVTPQLLTEASAVSYDGRVYYGVQKATIASGANSSGLLTSRTAFAAAFAGRIVGTTPAQPLTGKQLNVISIDRSFNVADQKNLIENGFLIADQNANGISIVRGVTATTDSIYFEGSVRRAVDAAFTTLRQSMGSQFVGRAAVPGILSEIAAAAESLMTSFISIPGGPLGYLRDFRNLIVSFNAADTTRIDISVEVLPLTPINFTFTSMYVHAGITFQT